MYIYTVQYMYLELKVLRFWICGARRAWRTCVRARAYAYAYAIRTVMCPSHDRESANREVSKNKMASATFGRNVLVLGASDSGAINVTLDSPQTIRYIKNRLQCRTVCSIYFNDLHDQSLGQD